VRFWGQGCEFGRGVVLRLLTWRSLEVLLLHRQEMGVGVGAYIQMLVRVFYEVHVRRRSIVELKSFG
jgi:hypothetical protein